MANGADPRALRYVAAMSGVMRRLSTGELPVVKLPAELQRLAQWVDDDAHKDARLADAVAIFEYWREKTGHKQAKKTSGRLRKVRARLSEGYTASDIKRAIDNVATSDFHQGKNDSGRKYDDLELICRNGEKLEQFIQMNDSGSKLSQDDWEKQAREENERIRRQMGEGDRGP